MVGGNCFVALSLLLKGKPCRPFNSDSKVRIDREGMRRFCYPDVQLVCRSNDPLSVFQDHPVLIIEVLFPSTRRYDLDNTMAAYLNMPSLEFYIVLEQHQPLAIVMRQSNGRFLREMVEGIEQSIDLLFLGCYVPMQAIYECVEFTAEYVEGPNSEFELTQLLFQPGPGPGTVSPRISQ
jgi:Uma2 family endonuclease